MSVSRYVIENPLSNAPVLHAQWCSHVGITCLTVGTFVGQFHCHGTVKKTVFEVETLSLLLWCYGVIQSFNECKGLKVKTNIIDGELDLDLDIENVPEDKLLTANERKCKAWLTIESRREDKELHALLND